LQRWGQRDPIWEGGGINLYDYVGNNPVNKIDPLGIEGYDEDSERAGGGKEPPDGWELNRNPAPGYLHPYDAGIPGPKEGFVPKYPNYASTKYVCPYKSNSGQRSYLDKKAKYWMPTNPRNAHGGPHWDVVEKTRMKMCFLL